MKAREVLNGLLIHACVHCDEPVEAEKGLREHNEMVDTALLALKEMVLQELNKYEPINPLHTIEDAKLYHKRILESVAKLFEDSK